MGLTVVSGVVATLSDIGQDETWLCDWLRERPARLGLGELHVVEDAAVEDGATGFLAQDDSRVLSVGVRVGELGAADAFGVLQGWAGSRAHEPEKEHVAVLVTEQLPERYRGTLEALAERLPLVVVRLAVWRGESEAIVVPHVALASDALDLADAPAAAAASVTAIAQAESASAPMAAEATDGGAGSAGRSTTDEGAPGEQGGTGQTAISEAANEAEAANGDGSTSPRPTEQEAGEDGDLLARLGSRDDTGIEDPWRLGLADTESGLLKGSHTAVASR